MFAGRYATWFGFLGALSQPVIVVTHVLFHDGVAFKNGGARYDVVDERPIKADEENRSCVVNQELFKKVKGLDIKVVGGFIQHKEIGGLREETGEHEALALPTGKTRNKRASLI